MGENSGCKCCNTWEEDMYWKHFNSIHFILTLNSEFQEHVVLPEKFAAHIKAQMPDKVSLKGPSGALWDIELQLSDDILFAGSGWKDFVEVNDLKENCILVLKYERNSGFDVLIFDQGSSCEKESSYFVQKCRQTKSDHEDNKKRTAREASSNEIIEDNGVGTSSFVASKKSKKDDVVVSLGGKLNTLASKKRVLNVASRCRGRPRRVVLPRKLPSKPKIQSVKSIRCETVKELSQISQRDLITLENGETSPEKDHSHKSKSQSKNSLNRNDNAKALSLISRELITPESGVHSPVAAKEQSGNHTANEPRQVSERQLINTEDGESVRDIDYSPKVKPQSEEQPRRHSTTNKQTQNFKEHTTPDNSKGLADLAEEEPSGSGAAKKLTTYSGNEGVISVYKESPSKFVDSCKSRGKYSRPKKLVVHQSSKKPMGVKRVSGKRGFSQEYISNRRPVTELEKEDALQRANLKQTENSFTTIMRPTGVYKRFFLQIPVEWMQKNVLHHKQKVVLRVGEKTWNAELVNYGCKSRGISTGWKKFALENFLEEFDVLVFKLVNRKDKVAVEIDVDIYRVVQEIVPPLPISS